MSKTVFVLLNFRLDILLINKITVAIINILLGIIDEESVMMVTEASMDPV